MTPYQQNKLCAEICWPNAIYIGKPQISDLANEINETISPGRVEVKFTGLIYHINFLEDWRDAGVLIDKMMNDEHMVEYRYTEVKSDYTEK